ncbi:MAG: FKBP-type peptidyl-prolyl cis-trans isomerase [Bacteroidetes bacterium]|jgi:FKBP-type peptidyl-prolyl cis-trans isomerase|nr:FKBP-type peptidyl-prolyl cis-trans isomerase [Bacteroidota bacterium]
MKKWFFFSICLAFVFGACKKKQDTACTAVPSTSVAASAEIDSLQRYLSINGITATQHESGVYYQVDSVGTGLIGPDVCNSVAVTYKGYLMGNPVPFQSFTDSIGIVFSVQDLIQGWQRTMPLMRAGGGMTIYIPPSLGYGSTDKKNPDGDIIVPKNSYLKFNVHLIEVY